MLKTAHQSTIERMTDNELYELVEWCSGFPRANVPTIRAAINEIRKRNENAVIKNGEMVFYA